jgi:hypothetical protein
MLVFIPLKLALAAAAVAAGAGVTTVVLLTSGPLAGHSTTPQAQVGTPSATTTPGPSGSASPIPPDHVIQPTDQRFDFDALPSVDQSGWKRLTGPNSTVSVSVPPDWEVDSNASVASPDGQAIGDAISLSRVPGGRVLQEGEAIPGAIHIDIVSQPIRVPAEPAGGDIPVRTAQLTHATNNSSVTLTAVQFGQSKQFPDHQGRIVFLPRLSSPGGLFVNGGIFIDLPATARDIATARAVLEPVEVK